MAYTLPDPLTGASLPFDTVIDVRSPAEYAEDHVPGAISLPAFSDEERAKVGTIYVQQSPFLARKVGAAILARNVATHLEGPLADKDGGWKPLVYCWRGGQRSGGFSTILAQIGWRVDKVEGGYQSYRRAVVRALYESELPYRVILLDGNTGTAKTDLLHRVAARGGQVLDLEGLANHRGSLLGNLGPQPSQKGFETALVSALSRLDPSRPVLVEAESSKVGEVLVPPALWKNMLAAPRITLSATMEDRARYLARCYADLAADVPRLNALLEPLVRLRGRERIRHWQGLAEAGDMQTLAAELCLHHYDPSYAKSRRTDTPETALEIALDDDGLDRAADRIMAQLGG
ncbi:tRNA 2-selenouridine(34) synthase MnmH [Oceanicola sp. 502str15]|uniref:tRNA 2-selenouridine(34) synthase MnmH n=1 Tax=Oceanicola sp. 502str15 TaxID=2696061 RepID=UPI0020966032|nr:tRNA 2-selenouridine(34) synthase MnmH [Oceanicola sp. 502str15]MCO6384448.1 tRNA 2-selenouridine(34) synthase MnmH [Oceanicola sp. 502str15]